MTLKKSQEMTPKTTQETTQKMTQKILDLIHKNPYITRQELSRKIGSITSDGVKYHLEQFKKQGILKRVGANKGGYWKVIKKLK